MNKIRPIEAIGELVADGDTVALGGAWFANHPMAAVRELVRQQRNDLHIVELLGSVDTDLLIGAGCVGELTFSMVTLEAFGLAPNFRRATEGGHLQLHELPSLTMNLAIECAGRNVPFLPLNAPDSDLLAGGEMVRTVRCPFTDRETSVVRPLRPKVAIVHALRADARGSAQFEGPLSIDPELAKAADVVIVTCEEIVTTDQIAANPTQTAIPGYLVDAVIEAPFGAHPTTHVPRYGLDAWELKAYAEAAADVDRFAALVDQIRSESEQDYRERVIGDRGAVLQALIDTASTLAPS